MKQRPIEELMGYAASPSNPPKGYGTIDKAVAVIKYRNERFQELDWPRSISYEEAAAMIEKEIIEKFGKPK